MAATTADSDFDTLDERDARALTEYMGVLDDVDRARDAPGLFEVVSASGSSYLVDTQLGSCQCWNDRTTAGPCKHRRRVAFATGKREIPDRADDDAVDEQLGLHIDNGVSP
ncbi:hypothetical protein [Haloarcula argentinensis]|uniref:hypothetical protein n=1 Tax=Haloarcula argentinensis TaxID=43776 RepID=UPI0002AFEA8C|nr:hypothetical protein [Haloarcula argentinensis]EMA18995.1 hypothetical protein C443_17833 [Haloarcula argentinensis DSM 12282]